ncbi:hypothetical protein JL475_23115 [Streptomyces sp. M2CJ-2]|uniref:hypothetical protein n=1 Tax=Streptomyces sp. M2CJ-2 TaxID=2803948 RepID=UPI0019261478|nr:hypothetical protein [Streptomyces sp. M2CJ-2]MBL3668834.1 hypothetical protein [Streptomyces sp. M2CJ-2]
MTAAVPVVLLPLVMSLTGAALAADHRGWRKAATRAYAGAWNTEYAKLYAVFGYVGWFTAVAGALFTVVALGIVIAHHVNQPSAIMFG